MEVSYQLWDPSIKESPAPLGMRMGGNPEQVRTLWPGEISFACGGGNESRSWSSNPQPNICRYWANSALCITVISKCVLKPELNASVLKKTLRILTSIALNTALVELASGRLFCRSLMTLTPCAFTCSGLRKAFSMFLCHSRVERGTITFLT